MRLRLHAEAEAEADAAAEWYDAERLGLGSDFLVELDAAFIAIAELPATWPRWPDAPVGLRVRRFGLVRFPFGVAYVVTSMEVVVLAIAHNSRRPLYWLGRAP